MARVVRVGLLRGAEFRGAAHMLPAPLGAAPELGSAGAASPGQSGIPWLAGGPEDFLNLSDDSSRPFFLCQKTPQTLPFE